MHSTADELRSRARERASWPVRRFVLGEEPTGDLRGCTTAAERLGMMWELARQAWTLSGRDLPDYRREAAPGRVLRGPR